MIDENVIYYGIFIDDNSKEKLLSYLEEQIPTLAKYAYGEDSRIYLDHVTLLFHNDFATNEDLVETIQQFEGKKFKLQATSIGKSDRAMAFGVNIDSSICANKRPHITVCTMNGGKLFESNNIKEWYQLGESIDIQGTLKAFRKK